MPRRAHGDDVTHEFPDLMLVAPSSNHGSGVIHDDWDVPTSITTVKESLIEFQKAYRRVLPASCAKFGVETVRHVQHNDDDKLPFEHMHIKLHGKYNSAIYWVFNTDTHKANYFATKAAACEFMDSEHDVDEDEEEGEEEEDEEEGEEEEDDAWEEEIGRLHHNEDEGEDATGDARADTARHGVTRNAQAEAPEQAPEQVPAEAPEQAEETHERAPKRFKSNVDTNFILKAAMHAQAIFTRRFEECEYRPFEDESPEDFAERMFDRRVSISIKKGDDTLQQCFIDERQFPFSVELSNGWNWKN